MKIKDVLSKSILIGILTCMSFCKSKKDFYALADSQAECCKSWNTHFSPDTLWISVLYAQEAPLEYTSSYSGLIIGVDSISDDTIAILDKRLIDVSELPNKLTVVNDQWSELEQEQLHPIMRVTDEERKDLFCSVRWSYYGSVLQR